MTLPRESFDPSKLQNDFEYCRRALWSEKAYKEVHSVLTQYCAPIVAKNLKHHFVDAFKHPHPEFGTLTSYLLAQAIEGLAYEEAMQWLITRIHNESYEREEKMLSACVMTIFIKLTKDAEFRTSFAEDKTFAPFLRPRFFNELRKIILLRHQHDLLQICEQVKAYPIDESLARRQLEHDIRISGTPGSLEHDAISAALFLSNDEKVFQRLDQIEAKLKERAGTRFDENTRLLQGYEVGKIYKHNKLLFGCLYDFVAELGFPGYSKIYARVSTEDFMRILASGMPFKDGGDRFSEHGEFAHLLQLICIGLEYQAHGNKFLCHHPAELLKWCGADEKGIDYWFRTFEQAESELLLASNIGRGVFKLHLFLRNETGQDRYPIMHQLIAGRCLKGTISKDKLERFGLFSLHPFTVDATTQLEQSTDTKPRL